MRPRPRPELWGQGRGQGQFLEVEAKAEAKDKVMNKKYQMMIDSIQVNLYHYDQNDTYSLISHSFWLSNYLLHVLFVWCPVVGKQTGQSLVGCWFFCCRPRPGRGQMFEAEADAKTLRPRPRPRPKFWPLWPRGPNISGKYSRCPRLFQATVRSCTVRRICSTIGYRSNSWASCYISVSFFR